MQFRRKPSTILSLVITNVLMSATLPLLAAETESLLEEVVVTAQKRDENVQDVPISITVFNNRAIEELGFLSTKDIAAQTPNLTVESPFAQSNPRFNLRGMGSNDFNSNGTSPVGVYVDEVFLNSPVSQGFQMYDLERVEVLRGPQGTLWGKNTTAGAIHFVSNKPSQEAFEGLARGTYGSFNQLDGEVVLSGPFGERFAGRAAVQYQSRDGWVENQFDGNDLEEYDKFAYRFQLGYYGDSVDALLNVHGGTLDSGGKATHHRNVGDFFGYTEFPEGAKETALDFIPTEDIDTSGAILTLNWDLGSMQLTSITAFEDHERTTLEDTDGSPNDVVKAHFHSEADQVTQELRLTSISDSKLQWIVGAYWLTESLESQTSFDVLRILEPILGTSFDPANFLLAVNNSTEQDTDNIAFFGHLTYEMNDQWTFSAGARWTEEEKQIDLLAGVYDPQPPAVENFWKPQLAPFFVPTVVQQEKESWDEITWDLGADYRPTDDLLVFASIRKGFRGGGFNGGALFSQLEAAIVDPETVLSYEVGAKSTWMDGRLQLNGGLFYYDYEDMQVFALGASEAGLPVQQLSNAARATVYGAEIELHMQPTDALFMQFGLGLISTEFDEYIGYSGGQMVDFSGNRLPRAPEKTFNGLLRYAFDLGQNGQLFLQTDFDYRDDIFFTPSNDPLLSNGKDFWVVNARVAWENVKRSVEVAAWVKNLGDEEYLVTVGDLSDFGLHQLYYGNPRTYGITATYRF